jgi:hypothetical protein
MPATDETTHYWFGDQSLQKLQEKYRFTVEGFDSDWAENPADRIYRLRFMNLTQAMTFATEVADPGAHPDVWLASQAPLKLWDHPVILAVRFSLVPSASSGEPRDYDEHDDIYAGTASE